MCFIVDYEEQGLLLFFHSFLEPVNLIALSAAAGVPDDMLLHPASPRLWMDVGQKLLSCLARDELPQPVHSLSTWRRGLLMLLRVY